MPQQYKEVAYFLKTRGLKGELKTVLLDDIKLDISQIESIFVKEKGQYIPYFIEYIHDEESALIVKLEDVDSPETAANLRGKKIFIPTEALVQENETTQYDQLVGYSAYNQNQKIGKILKLEEYPQQVMALIQDAKKDFLIPLVEEFVISIDNDAEEIHFQLPEGILDL